MNWNHLTEGDRKLVSLLSQSIEHYLNGEQLSDEQEREIHSQILDLFDAGQTTHSGAIQIMSSLLSANSSSIVRLWLVNIMGELIMLNNAQGKYSYPEFFWPVLKSNILFEVDNISDITRVVTGLLCRTGGADIVRSYLIHVLLNEEKSKHRNAILAFYPTGHTMESLRIVVQVLPPFEEASQDLYVFVYGDALNFLKSKSASGLTNDEKAFLLTFFTQGLSLNSLSIVEDCKKALKILEEPSTRS